MANVSVTSQLIVPPVPALPLGPVDYSRQYQDQLNNVLRLYFQQLGGAFAAYVEEGGGRFGSVPCGSYFSNQTTTLSANVVTTLTLNNTDANATIDTALSNGSVQVAYPGVYNYQFSAQFENSDSQAHDVEVWAKVDGNNVYESATQLTIPSRHGSRNGAAVAAWNFFLVAEANSTFDLVVAASHPDIKVAALPASSSPFVRPSIPSLITTVTFVSRLPT
jgi:hypothetical protein